MAASPKTILLTTSAAPDQTPFSTTEKRPPIGIGFLISMLRNAGHIVLFKDYYLSNTALPDARYLNGHNIDFVGIYINTICFRHSLVQMYQLHYLRQSQQWNGKIIVGGPHTTVAASTIPEFVDFVVQGEGEHAIVDIVEGKVSERIVCYPRIQDLDTLPMPAWDIFTSLPYNWECSFFPGKPVFTMNTSRGCPYKCTFCSVGSIWGKQYTMFSAERVVADIEFLIHNHGAQGIYFREDNFTLNRNRLKKFCALMLEKKITIPWVCETRVNTLTRDIVQMMAQSGARGFYFGVESGSQRLLDFMEKGITVGQIRQAFAWCREFNISTAASIVVGLPTETSEDVKATEQLIREIVPTVTWYNVFVGIPTSKLYIYSIENRCHEFIDDRGLVYLRDHDKLTRRYYGAQWNADVPVKTDSSGRVVRPVISVVMSVYNGERYLEKAIRSVLVQTYPNFEFIIVNDASTDGSAAIIQGIGDPRIHLVHSETNCGLTASLVKGIKCARGTYIARMDADDLSLPHRFETELAFLEKHHDHACVGSSFYLINEVDVTLGIIPVRTENDQLQQGLTEKNWFCHGSVLMRASAYESVNGYNTEFRYAQDYDLWLRVAEKFKIANIREPLYSWRDSPGCVSRAKAAEQQMFADKARELAKSRRSSVLFVNNCAPLVSIIVPTFNRPQLIGNAILSILNQTYPNVEIIVVNDCGTPVEDIVFGMNKKDSIVYVRHARNGALAAARNTGIRMARGTYIGYLDDDDLFYPDHVETLAGYLLNNKAQVAYSDAFMASQRMTNGIWETRERKLLYSMDFNNDAILIHNLFPVLCIVHEKRCIDTTGGFDESFKTHEDWDLWIRMSRSFRLHHIKKVTAEYLVRTGNPEQMTTNPASNYNETRKTIYKKYAEYTCGRADILQAQEAELVSNDPALAEGLLLQKLNNFIGEVSLLIEKGDFQGGIALFDMHRNKFPDTIPELARIDALMTRVREKCNG